MIDWVDSGPSLAGCGERICQVEAVLHERLKLVLRSQPCTSHAQARLDFPGFAKFTNFKEAKPQNPYPQRCRFDKDPLLVAQRPCRTGSGVSHHAKNPLSPVHVI